MSACCDGGCSTSKPPADPRYRRILWIALWVNALMFGVELLGGWRAGSVSLLADAVDFLGDAANYGISLFVLALAPVWRSRTALVKGVTMGLYGIFVLGTTLWHLRSGTVPQAQTMGAIGMAALAGKGWSAAEVVRDASIDGLPGQITLENDALPQTIAVDIDDGKIKAIYVTRNPDKLARLGPLSGA